MDEDDYWNQSASTSFSFEDEDQIYSQESTTSKAVNETTKQIQSISIQRKISSDTISEFGEESQFTINSHIPLNILISEQNLQKIIEEQSMVETQLPKGITPEQELKILRRRVQEKFHPHPVCVTINRIIVKKPFSLECYRSLIEKESLLDESISSGCGDAILTVILFLTTTLDRSIWIEMLRIRPMAVNHYLNYLIKISDLDECTFLLNQLGKYSQLALLQFDTLMKSFSGINEHKRGTNEKINEIFELYFKKSNVNPILINLITNYQILLDWHKNHIAPRSGGIIKNTIQLNNSSVLESVYYACIHHKWNDSLCRYNPKILVDQQNVSQAQYEWIVLNEMAYSQKWRNLETFFEKKSWHNLKGKTFSMNIPIEMTILQLFKINAPMATLNHFLAHISDARQRLLLAKRMAATKTIVDALFELKERNELEAFVDTIEPNTDVRFYAEGKIKNMK